jgi:excisionase family DNA binding protein
MELFKERYLTSSEVCDLLRISKRTLIRWTTRAKRPRLTFVRNGRRILFPKTDINRYIAARTTMAAR